MTGLKVDEEIDRNIDECGGVTIILTVSYAEFWRRHFY